MTTRLSTLALLVVLLAPLAGAATDPLRLQLFSGIDREAVEVGGLLEVEVEVLAVPATPAARDALDAAFRAWDVGQQLGSGFEVIRETSPMGRATGDVVELQRRVIVRVLDATVDAVPALTLRVPMRGRTWAFRTRPHALRTFADDEAVRTAARSVVAITAEGELDGVRFERIGSAFAIGDDALVTAYHVVVGARRVRVTLPTGRQVSVGRAWALDPVRDVAVLHLPPEVAQAAGHVHGTSSGRCEARLEISPVL